MNELIIVQNGEAVTTSLIIADGVNHPHKNVISLVRKYKNELARFGRVEFKILPFETTGGTQSREVAFLNERQATFVLTCLRNNDAVINFKIALVQAFFDMAERLKVQDNRTPSLPDFTNPAIAARAWAEQFEQRQVAESKIFALTNQIKADKPKIDLADKFLDSTGDFIIRMVAKALGVGVMKLYDWMRQKKLISKTNEPYAEFCTRGILRPVPGYHEGSNGERKCKLTTHVTSKGVFYLHQRLISDGLIPAGKQIDFEYLMTKEAA